MVPANILARTFFIKGQDYGSAFTVDVDGHEYLITARHLLDQTGTSTPIRLFHSEKWWDISAEVVGHGHGEIDLSVLRLPHRLAHPELTVTPTIAGLALGQDAYFLGFPYKL